ncbi:hypothetical protein FF1_012084 [Malus domestica]
MPPDDDPTAVAKRRQIEIGSGGGEEEEEDEAREAEARSRLTRQQRPWSRSQDSVAGVLGFVGVASSIITGGEEGGFGK